MNDRIHELMDQVGISREYLTNTKQIVLLEQFAELIINECVGIAADQRDWVENMVVFSERDKFWNKARIVQSQRIVDKIKQHFGVK